MRVDRLNAFHEDFASQLVLLLGGDGHGEPLLALFLLINFIFFNFAFPFQSFVKRVIFDKVSKLFCLE